MRPVRFKAMGDAMISKSCSYFLSDIAVPPGIVQSGGVIRENGRQTVHFDRGWALGTIPAKMRYVTKATIVRDKGSKRAILSLEYRGARFYETPSGRSKLILLNQRLPETVANGLPAEKYNLLDVVDFSKYKPIFIVRSNPKVVSIKNVTKKRMVPYRPGSILVERKVRCLEIALYDDWSASYWGYWDCETGYHSTIDCP